MFHKKCVVWKVVQVIPSDGTRSEWARFKFKFIRFKLSLGYLTPPFLCYFNVLLVKLEICVALGKVGVKTKN